MSAGVKNSAATAAATPAVKGAAAKGPKRRRNERNILTFYEKIAVIRYYDETNISRNSLAKMFHCCTTQIRRILERKAELLQQLATLSEADASIIIEEMTRKRRKFEMSAISFILHQWVERCRQLQLRKTITNQTLKETALKMAAILNLPAFRPSYRWLNRFRGKYKYNDEDLGVSGGAHTVPGELSVEDIIIEFKDSLPSFMQKEISTITDITTTASTTAATMAKLDDAANQPNDHKLNEETTIITKDRIDVVDLSNDNSLDCDISDEALDNEMEDEQLLADGDEENDGNAGTETDSLTNLGDIMNAGTSTLLNSVFPHLAVLHQFALMNSDIKALELISQLGVHMQTQATDGAYKQLSLATTTTNETGQDNVAMIGSSIYGDIDDIELIE